MTILGWNTNLTLYVWTAVLGGIGLGIMMAHLSEVYSLGWQFGLTVALVALVLSLYLWHGKKVKDLCYEQK